MATWRDRGYVPDSDEGEVEGDGESESTLEAADGCKDRMAEASLSGSGREKEEVKVLEENWYDIDELSNEYDHLYGGARGKRGEAGVAKSVQSCRIERGVMGGGGGNDVDIGPQSGSPRSGGNGMATRVEDSGPEVYNGEVVDLVDLEEDDGLEGSPSKEVLFEIPNALLVTETEMGTSPLDEAQTRPGFYTGAEQLDLMTRPNTPTFSINTHQPAESAPETPPMNIDRPSTSSSTLSSPPTILSTPSGSLQGLQGRMTRDSSPVQVVIPQRSSHLQLTHLELTTDGETESELPRRFNHTLRKRNPIQLHPYLLEGQRYKQSLRASGIKPVRVVEVQSQVARVPRAKDSQDQEFHADDSQPNGVNDVSQGMRSSQPQKTDDLHVSAEDDVQSQTEGDSTIRVAGDDEEFPDIDTLLQRQLGGAVQQGHKRRKTKQTSFRRVPPRASATANPVEAECLSTRNLLSRVQSLQMTHQSEHPMEQTIFDFPVSPSHPVRQKLSRPTSPATPSFRFPKGFTPQTRDANHVLEAPKRRVIIESSEESDSKPRRPSRRVKPSRYPSTFTSPSPPSSSEEEPAVQLRSVQRKIRGVLPASWLRLDQQNQTRGAEPQTKEDRRSRHLLPAKSIDRPGLARKKSISSLNTSIAPGNSIEIPDDSDDSSDGEHPHGGSDPLQALPNSQAPAGLLQVWPDLGEAEEDNRVDDMGPSARNPRRMSKPSKKRQRRLDEPISAFDSRQLMSILSSKSGSGNTYQPRITDHLPDRKSTTGKRKAHKKRQVPRLSILDAPETTGLGGAIPQFLRLANRQARSRRDKARHTPSGKVIKLHTWKDTEDVQSVLRDWREGTILPVANGPPSSTIRSSRHAGHSNAKLEKKQTRLPPPLSWPSGDNPKNIKERLMDSRPKFLKPVVRQTRLNPVVRRSVAFGTGHDRNPLRPRTPAQVNADPRSFWVPTSKSREGPKPAQLEVLETELPNRNRRAAFASDLSLLDRLYQKQVVLSSRESNLQLSRFLAEDDENTGAPLPFEEIKTRNSSRTLEQASTLDTAPPIAVIRKPRKRPPKRLDLGSTEYSLSDNPILIKGRRIYVSPTEESKEKVILQGLRPYGTYHTSNFEIIPLKIGTYFHESTFIGSGDLSKAIQTASRRNYHLHVGYATFDSVERSLRWSSWDDTVSSELGSEFEWLALSIEQLCDQVPVETEGGRVLGSMSELKRFLKFVISYFKDFLSFADPIDRNSFVRRSTQVFQGLLERFVTIFDQAHRNPDRSTKLITQMSMFLLILIYQVLQIAKKGSLEISTDTEVQELLLKSSARWLIRLLLHQDLKRIRSFYEDNQRLSKRDNGIRDESYFVEGWVVLIQVLRQPDGQSELFWGLLNEQLGQDKIPSIADVQFFEQSWYGVISMLPLFEFDEFGVFEVGRRFRCSDDNWKFVKALTSRLLAIYTANPSKQLATFNSYCRTVFSRCHYLITGWGWRKCESIVGTLFDFFASNNLAHLHKEDIRGSPRFLGELDQEQSLEIEPEDRCFHILLKIIGVGLKAMSQIYPERKIRNITFRLMPNHGRQYPKEEPVHHQDLESLRNHHNLLCTLYWASPPSARPSVNVIRDLVNPETSHRGACHISIRAWSNLIRFQLSTKEPVSSLEPFMKWHNELTSQMLRQHGLARTEAQAHFTASANDFGITAISPELLEKTISDNQEQVEAVLSDALISMKIAMAVAKSVDMAMVLLSRSSTADVFQLFDAKKHKLNKVVSLAIAIVQEYVRIFNNRNDRQPMSQGGEDSQDYGDWSALEDIVSQEFSGEAAEHLCNTVYDSLLRLVSNCFGADVVPDDAFLLAVTDAWVSVAQSLVKGELKQWNNFIGSYSRESWSSLRSTEQTRKFTAYFMSKVIESDATSYKANKHFFLSCWMSSLVERESLLKFQNRFTNVLLNHDRDNPILRNLPFWMNRGSDGYAITAHEFRARPVLANIRESVEESALVSIEDAIMLRQGYAELLKSLMGSMKSNYEEIRQGSICTGAYVEFVQKVVEFLQQHTIEICPVDKFFTDSSVFPLPATDPTYVVGRLKNYGLRLSEPRVHTQLAMFLQSVSERAAAEQQQSYLTGQLSTAMSDTFESGDVKKPTLRAFLTQAIFPAYIEVALDTPTGWILARSVLRALERMFDTLLTDIDSGDPACVESAIAILAHVLDSFRRSTDPLIAHSELLEQPTVLNTLTSFFSTITSMLHPLDYLQRRSHRGAHAVKCIAFFTAFAAFISHILKGHPDEAVSPYVNYPDFPPLPTPFLEVRNSSTRDLRAMLMKNWSRHGDEYHVVRGNATVEVAVEIGSFEEERARLMEGLNDYLDVVGRMRALQGRGTGDKWRTTVGALFL